MQEELLQFKLQQVCVLVDLPNGAKVIGTKWVYRNKKDEWGVVVRNNIDYDEVFAPVARIEAIRFMSHNLLVLLILIILQKVASLKSRSIDKGRRYKRRKETKSKKVEDDAGAEKVNTAGEINAAGEEVNTASKV
ncbi:copia protein, partial [Tanacetum coccineum]